MDKTKIKEFIKERMIEELRYGDSDIICCDDILDGFELPEDEDEEDVADMIFEEWRKYVDKIEEFLRTLE